MNKLSLLSMLLLGAVATANAQTQKVIADKIVAQVGDKIILRSDIFNAISDYKRRGEEAQLPPDPECAFLEGQLVQKALVLQAQKDSLPVDDEDLNARLDNQVRGFISMYGSKEILEQIAGETVYQLKEDFRQPFKEKMMADEMRKKILENVKITPTEVKEFYDKIPKDSLAYYESQIEVSSIVILPKANKDVDEYVTGQLNEWKKQIESGAKKFDAMARLYSEEPAAQQTGGQMQINRTDKNIDPSFLTAAFRLKEGQISPVVRSKFGLHIIQMVSRAGDDAIVRHIIRIPPVTTEEINAAKSKLDSIRTAIMAGRFNFADAVNRFSDDDNAKFTGGAVMGQDGSTYVNYDNLDKEMVATLKDQNMKVGDISKPEAYTDERGRKGARIFYLKTRTEPHRENMKDDYNTIAQSALNEKKQAVLNKWFRDHIPTYYVTIDKEFQTCGSISQWWTSAATASK